MSATLPLRRSSPLQKRVHDFLDPEVEESRWSRLYGIGIQLLILLNVAALVVETVPGVRERWGAALDAVELVSVAVFTTEYVLRLWAAPADRGYHGRLRYATRPMMVVDLLAVLPFWLAWGDLRALRTLRFLRILRLAKLARYSAALRSIGRVFGKVKEELAVTLFVVVVLLFVSSTLMYYAENAAQPDKFSSIPASMWWAICTLTTVGYGDVFPITPLGRAMASAIAVLGVGMFALPAGILGSAFSEEIRRARAAREGECCGQCGRPFREP